MLPFILAFILAFVGILPNCEFEDSPNCKWLASESGNGQGMSFFDLGGNVYYLP